MDDDDVSLLVPREERNEEVRQELQAEEIKSSICKIGITQLVFGVGLIGGGVGIMCSWPYPGIDRTMEGIWCGAFVVVCGSLSVAVRFHFYAALVITCLTINILTAVLVGSGVIVAAVSSFSNLWYSYGLGFTVGFVALNMGLIACLILSIYLAVVFGKVLAQGRESYCCYPSHNPAASNLMMVYVPAGTQAFNPAGGAHVAVPENSAFKAQPGPI